jgi:hypothetical protein
MPATLVIRGGTVVDGRVAVADGELTKETPGRRLRRGR